MGGTLFVAYVVVTIVVAVASIATAVIDFAEADFVIVNMRELGLRVSWLPMLGALKAAGGVGLLLGLAGLRWLGIAAAGGLVLFFVGAIIVHIYTRVLRKIAIPGGFLAMAVAALALAVAG